MHYDVYSTSGDDERAGSVVWCPCCEDTSAGPLPDVEACGLVNIRPGFTPPWIRY
jgi:hypothetical protein